MSIRYAGVASTKQPVLQCNPGEIVAALAVLLGEGGVRYILCSGSYSWLPLTTPSGVSQFEEVCAARWHWV